MILMEKGLLSILVPVFQVEHYLRDGIVNSFV